MNCRIFGIFPGIRNEAMKTERGKIMMNHRRKSIVAIIILIVVCTALSQGLHLLSKTMEWPVWLDLTGVVLAACLGGPLAGVITALLNNISLAVFFYGVSSLYYALVTVTLALIVGFAVKKKWVRGPFSYIGLTTVAFFDYVLTTTVLNMIIYDGTTLNAATDEIFHALVNLSHAPFFASLAAKSFYGVFDIALTAVLVLILYFVTPIPIKEQL